MKKIFVLLLVSILLSSCGKISELVDLANIDDNSNLVGNLEEIPTGNITIPDNLIPTTNVTDNITVTNNETVTDNVITDIPTSNNTVTDNTVVVVIPTSNAVITDNIDAEVTDNVVVDLPDDLDDVDIDDIDDLYDQLLDDLQDRLSQFTTSIEGTVDLEKSNNLQDVDVYIGSSSVDFQHAGKTDNQGGFDFDVTNEDLESGYYTLRFQKSGFDSVEVDNVPVNKDSRNYSIDVNLERQEFNFTHGLLAQLDTSFFTTDVDFTTITFSLQHRNGDWTEYDVSPDEEGYITLNITATNELGNCKLEYNDKVIQHSFSDQYTDSDAFAISFAPYIFNLNVTLDEPVQSVSLLTVIDNVSHRVYLENSLGNMWSTYIFDNNDFISTDPNQAQYFPAGTHTLSIIDMDGNATTRQVEINPLKYGANLSVPNLDDINQDNISYYQDRN